jgi:flagellar hook-associated protein 2
MATTSSILGVISGLDTDSILSKLRTVAETPITNLQTRRSTLDDKATAWTTLDTKLTALQTYITRLSKASNFETRTATASNSSLVSATATSSAVNGTYTFSVEQLAQNGQVASQGYADSDTTELGSGNVSVTVGGTTIDISAGGMTLEELRDAINGAVDGATASIINDGDSTSPYRLVVTADETGADNAVSLSTTISDSTAPTFTELQTAQDSIIKLGSGSSAISVSSSTNSVTTAIQGVTLNLLDSDPGTSVTVTVANNTSSIESLVEGFVTAYNAVNDFFDEQFAYDTETETSGTLFGDYRLLSIQNSLRDALFNRVAGSTSDIASLADLGVTTLSTGELSLDSTKLGKALTNDIDGVMKLFAASGSTTNSAVSFVNSTSATKASKSGGYSVEVTQAARQARVTAGAAMASTLTSDESLVVGGVSISLSSGMTQAQVLETINSRQTATGIRASLTGADGTGTGDYLTFTRTAYGSAYHATVLSTVSNATSGGTGVGTTQVSDSSPQGESGSGTGAVGLNVEGTIGGYAATGSGQRLTGSEGDAEGLCLLITATTAGSYGDVVFTTGVAALGLHSLEAATDTTDGTIAVAQTSITDQQTLIDEEIERLQASVDAEIARLEDSFANMEEALAKLQSQSTQLTNFIAGLNGTSDE